MSEESSEKLANGQSMQCEYLCICVVVCEGIGLWLCICVSVQYGYTLYICIQFGLFSVPTSGPQLVHQRMGYVLSCLCERAYKDPLMHIRKSSLSGDNGFPLKKCHNDLDIK